MAAAVLRVACRGALCAVIPDKRNAYRPYLLRHPVLAFLNAAVIVAVLGGSLALSLTPEIARLSTIASPIITRLTNAERAHAGRPALKEHKLLQRSAQLKAEHMLRHDYFEHTSPDGLSPWVWFDRAKYEYAYAGENLAIDFSEAEDVVAAWVRSQGHRRNLLSDRYLDIGVAVATGEFQGRTATIVVQHFGARRVARSTQRTSPSRPAVAQATAFEPPTAPLPEPAVVEPAPSAVSTVTAEKALVLPDPRGLPGVALLVLAVPREVVRLSTDVPGQTPMLLTLRAGVASARIPFPERAAVNIRMTDEQGNTRAVTLKPFLAYTTRAAEASGIPRATVASGLGRLRSVLAFALIGLAGLLSMNLLAHLRFHRILHADLLAHATLVLALGAALVLFT